MRITHIYETLEETATRKPTREEAIVILERKKRALLHEMKVLALQIKAWGDDGYISQLGEEDKNPDAPKIPNSESRRILTTDQLLVKKILNIFERFTLIREILSNGLLPELATLEASTDSNQSGN